MPTVAELLPDFRTEFPEYVSQSDAVVEKHLNNALLIHAICGGATIYLAAHLLTLSINDNVGTTGGSVDGGGIEREVTAERGRDINATYKSGTDRDSDSVYISTPYGRMYLRLRDACPGRKFSVRVT